MSAPVLARFPDDVLPESPVAEPEPAPVAPVEPVVDEPVVDEAVVPPEDPVVVVEPGAVVDVLPGTVVVVVVVTAPTPMSSLAHGQPGIGPVVAKLAAPTEQLPVALQSIDP